MENKKTVLGQFFTRDRSWLKPQVIDFIRSSGCHTAFDPFAGGGDLLAAAEKLGLKTVGMDVDGSLGWEINDSLLSIPHIDDKTLIITNPPYLSNYSASRKGIMADVRRYFDRTDYDDLYLLSLDNMLKSRQQVVAIIPETFINSAFRDKRYLHSVTILEENPFYDTDAPVVVACFDGVPKDLSAISVYKNETRVNDLGTIEALRLKPQNDVEMTFNDANGWLAVRCVDSTDPNERIRFDFAENISYDWEKGIKVSSRLLTLVGLDVPVESRPRFLAECNKILGALREATDDIIFSPFKGNMKNGRRRRRLDFKTCRAIIEIAYRIINGEKGNDDHEQLWLF